MKKYGIRTLAALSALIALHVVLSRFCSISAWNIKIGFAFVPVAAAAMLFGAAPAAIVGALGDFLGAVLFPIGPYFPGFTLTSACTGLVFGLLLRENPSPWRIGGAVAINQLVLGLAVNTLWISVLYGSPYFPLMATRVIQCAVLLPVEFVTISALKRLLEGGVLRRA